MFDMTWTGRVRFGAGVSAQVGELLRSLGAERVVVVTDENMERLGTADRICAHLEAAEVHSCVFAGVEPEPSVETTDAVAELAREHDCQAVVGLGGGSCMDVAKAVSILITNQGSAAAYQGQGLVKVPGVPKVMIPTTAGTGSEVTSTAVLCRTGDGFKGSISDDRLRPDYSLLDPELTFTMPPKVTASTGMDALVHALEGYTSRQASPFRDLFAREALTRIGKWLRIATWTGKDLEARSEMLLASFYAGVALANAGVGACHALAYPLGGSFGVGHGCCNALMLPYVVRYNVPARSDRYAQAAAWLGLGTEGWPDREAALACAEGLEDLVEDLSLPRKLSALKAGIEEKHFDALAEVALGMADFLENNPRPLDKKACIVLYKEAF